MGIMPNSYLYNWSQSLWNTSFLKGRILYGWNNHLVRELISGKNYYSNNFF